LGLGEEPSVDQIQSDEAVLSDLRRQAAAAPTLVAGEAERLLKQSALGDRVSQEKLVAASLDMVIRLADTRPDRGLSALDLVQEGSIGLVEAVQTFADSGESNFAAFAEKKVGEQMDAAIAAEAAAVREAELLITAAADYDRVEMLLARELHRPPTEQEIGERLEWTVDRTRYVAQIVADARRRHDEELLAYIDPEAIDFNGEGDDESGPSRN
jgi:DNA-directed RNA polymerase sigma subunit (sigma70/sigma32)